MAVRGNNKASKDLNSRQYNRLKKQINTKVTGWQ